MLDVAGLAEITSPDFPGERLVACMNPFPEAGRPRKRESLLAAAEADLAKIAAACARARAPLRGQANIAVRADRVLRRRKVARHFTIKIGEDHLSYARNPDSITAGAALDGICVVRTSIAAGDLNSGEVVSSCKTLAQPGRAFRALHTDLDIARAAAVHRRRQGRRPRRPDQPRRPRRPLPAPWPRPPPSRLPPTSRCIASPPCSPASPRSA